MNIIFVTRLFYPHVGGVEKHVTEVSRLLIKNKHSVTVFTGKHKTDLKDYEIVNKIKIYRIKYPKLKVVGLFVIWFRLLELLNLIQKTDIIHIHDVFIWYFPLRFLLPRKKVFMTFHGYSDYPVPKIAIIYQKIAKKLTKGNITIGKVIEKWFGIKADIISYGAVDLEKFKPVKKKKFKYDAVFASRLDDQTGILTYLDALAILKEKGVEFKLVILGDGKYKSKADKLALTHGWVADPSPYFKESRFAFVNRYLGILEAFASKKLVFSVYDNPIKKDYIYLTPFKNWMIVEEKPERLAQKILYYKDKPLKTRDMIESAYFWVKNQTWEKMVDNYIKLWST